MALSTGGFITALYHGILGREPDAQGLAAHVAALGDNPGPMQVMHTVEAFVGSAEFRTTHPVRAADFQLAPKMDGPAFSHVASLGSFCYPALMLKHMRLRQSSLPFDWIFSSLSMVEHCIRDDFASFADAACYRVNPVALRPAPDLRIAEHVVYGAPAFGVNETVFNHYDPTDPERYAYLLRCVGRFRRLLDSPGRTLFLAMVPTATAASLAADFRRLAETLDRYARAATLMVLAVLPHQPNSGAYGTNKLEQVGPHRLYALRPFSALQGLSFADPFDDLFVRRLMAGYRYEVAGSGAGAERCDVQPTQPGPA